MRTAPRQLAMSRHFVAIDRTLHAVKLAAELRAASRQVGRRLLTETAALVDDDTHARYRRRRDRGTTPATPPSRSAYRGRPGDSAGGALLAFCHSHTVGILGAAMRLLPVTHSQVQAILHRLHPVIAREARPHQPSPLAATCASFTPELDLVAIGHETDDLRQFAS